MRAIISLLEAAALQLVVLLVTLLMGALLGSLVSLPFLLFLSPVALLWFMGIGAVWTAIYVYFNAWMYRDRA